ncbi:MAG: SDR family NAD(P)-dependent oxidoreductase [Desulfobacterales bacterium]
MAVLLTGGAGYIGSHTCVVLLENGYDVVVVDNLCNSSQESLRRVEKITGQPVAFYRSDLRDETAMNDIFRRHSIDAVIHFAGLKSVAESVDQPLAYYENNINSTLVLCAVMQKHEVKNFVFSSSATVYGNPETVPIDENAPVRPFNPYGRTKLFIEEILKKIYMRPIIHGILPCYGISTRWAPPQRTHRRRSRGYSEQPDALSARWPWENCRNASLRKRL